MNINFKIAFNRHTSQDERFQILTPFIKDDFFVYLILNFLQNSRLLKMILSHRNEY